MAKPSKDVSKPNTPSVPGRPEARVPKGMRDIGAAELRETWAMTQTLRRVYERYGFEPLETPAFEYTDALGKFLPDQDRPNAGVFSFTDEDSQWLSLRYDLTAPLARYYAENAQSLPKPFRRYAFGPVWRNEKPGPGRFRQFMQFDADTVGAESVAADAEMCMLAADALEALGVPRGQYVIKVNNRKVLDGVLQSIGVDGENAANTKIRLAVLRALDKLDKFSWTDVALLLGNGRRDESGDFTEGAGLGEPAIEKLSLLFSRYTLRFGSDTPELREAAARSNETPDMWRGGFDPLFSDEAALFNNWREMLVGSELGLTGISELEHMAALVRSAGYGPGRIAFDPSVVRGLEYYTGPVFEAELTFEVKDEDGRPMRFGSVGGGGRYDDLVARFTGERVPATGFSVGVSRLQAALAALRKSQATAADGPVVVLVMEKDRIAETQRLVQALRNPADGGNPIRAEMYLGGAGMKAQMKYADRRRSPAVVIQGSDERARGEVTIKDLVEGAKAAAAIKDNKEWKAARPAQVSVKEADLVAEVRAILARQAG